MKADTKQWLCKGFSIQAFRKQLKRVGIQVITYLDRPPVRVGHTGGLPSVNFEKWVDFTGKCTNKPR